MFLEMDSQYGLGGKGRPAGTAIGIKRDDQFGQETMNFSVQGNRTYFFDAELKSTETCFIADAVCPRVYACLTGWIDTGLHYLNNTNLVLKYSREIHYVTIFLKIHKNRNKYNNIHNIFFIG